MSYVVFLFKQTAMKITMIHMPTSHYKQSYNLVKSIMYNLCKTVKKNTILTCKVCYYFFSGRCLRPVIPQNGWLIGINFAYGGEVRIVCKFKNGTLDLRRSSKIICNHGVWSNSLLSCEGKDR